MADTTDLILSDTEKKDVRLIVLEIQNTGLQIQALQSQFKELQAAAVAFEDAMLKSKNVARQTHALDFNTGTILENK